MGFTIYPPALIYEYMPKGSLYQFLYNDKTDIDWTLIVKLAQEVAEGMRYLHSQNPPIIHGSLVSKNIFITDDYHIKIGFVGWSSINNNEEVAIGTFRNRGKSTAWMAPELIMGMNETTASDVYSYGVLLYELIYRTIPFADCTPAEITEKVLKGIRPDGDKESQVVQPLVNLVFLMRECWTVKPHIRLSFDEILEKIKQIVSDELNIETKLVYNNIINRIGMNMLHILKQHYQFLD